MAAFATVKLLLVGCLLYLCLSLGSARPSGDAEASISTAAESIVKQSLSARVYTTVYGHGRQLARLKREVVTKTLADPKQCVSQCRDNETAQIMKVTLKNIGQLVALSLSNISGDEVSTPEKEAAFKKRVEATTIANMGPFFADLCSVSKQTFDCFSSCPDSNLRNIMTLDNTASQEAFCEPGKNWNNFTEYWNALNCTNSTELEKPCDNKCGSKDSIRNATKLEIDDEINFDNPDDDQHAAQSVSVKFENDSKKNTATAGPICKTVSCRNDCYKPIMTQKCGSKAYDMYSRMSKVEPRTTLGILKILNAVDQTSECKLYQ